jgi:hypothetical protein
MSTHASYQDQLLAQNLHAILGDLDDSAMNLLRQRSSGWNSPPARR